MKAAIETQVCTKCEVEKPLSEYHFRKDKQKHRRDCKDCQSKYNKTYHKAYRKANLEKLRVASKVWRDTNPEKHRANAKAWKKANSERKKATDKAWRKANTEKHRAGTAAWQKANPEKCRAKCAKRKADRIKATPAWADLKKIAQIYKDCPPGHHVDHYFPLQSPIMCGLHVQNNLQFLPAKENISKGNRVSLEQQLNG